MVGSPRFMNANLANKRVEIGFTFLGRTWQRSQANTEAKLLPLTHTFETLGLNRVELMTDYLNDASRRAILRLGAKEEGEGPGQFIAPHGIAVDSRGAIYVSEVSYTIRGSHMDPPRELRSLSKYDWAGPRGSNVTMA